MVQLAALPPPLAPCVPIPLTGGVRAVRVGGTAWAGAPLTLPLPSTSTDWMSSCSCCSEGSMPMIRITVASSFASMCPSPSRSTVGRAGHAAWARAAEASSTQGVPTAQAPSQAPASELHCRLSSAATPPALAASYGCAAWVLEGASRTKFGERLVYLHQLGGGQARYQRVVLA